MVTPLDRCACEMDAQRGDKRRVRLAVAGAAGVNELDPRNDHLDVVLAAGLPTGAQHGQPEALLLVVNAHAPVGDAFVEEMVPATR